MQSIKKKRQIDYSWDFITANTKEYTHCYHNYPAMMIPQVARRLLKEYLPKNSNILFDPYCGTGTSLVEANLTGLKNIGTDLNPLAILIAKAKNTLYDLKILKQDIDFINNEIFRFSFYHTHEIDKPKFENIRFWFSDEVIDKLAFLKNVINSSIRVDNKSFFLVAFSETVRETSFTRNGEFKLYRIQKDKLITFKPDVFHIFQSKLQRNYRGLSEFSSVLNKINTKVYNFNTCNSIPNNISDREVDIVVTSPPYGDSKTTVAYGQYSRLTNQWLDIKDANQIDNLLMGGSNHKDLESIEISSAKEELANIEKKDKKRYKSVLSFLYDYSNSINNISYMIRKNGIVCYVVGNRNVKGTQIPLDLITAELFINNGFEHLKTIIRNIPNKRMPSKNSPTNVIGALSPTMKNEYIVILKKN
jgi:DNA modification methylase